MVIDYQKSVNLFVSKLIEDFEFHPEKHSITFHQIISRQQKKDFDRLINLYTSNIAYNPTNASAYYNRGLIYNKKASYKQALNDFTKAIELDQNFTFAFIARGETYVYLKEYDLSDKDFERAMQLNNKNPTIYTSLGNIRRIQYCFKESIKYFNKAIELNDSIESAFYGRAMAYRGLKDYQNAIKDFTKAIELNPNDSYAFCNRGIAYSSINFFDEALKDFDEALNLKPDDVFVLNNKGLVYRKKGENDTAEINFKMAMEKMPEDCYAYYNLGNLSRESDAEDKGLKLYCEAIDLDYSFIPAYIAKANVFIKNNDLTSAEEEIRQAIEFMPQSSICYTMFGYIKFLSKDYNAAVENFKFAINNDINNNPELIYFCALSYFYLEDYLVAEKFFTKAIDLSFEVTEALYARALCFFRLKQCFSEVLEKDDSLTDAYFYRGISFVNDKKYENAYNDFEETINKNYLPGESNFYMGLCNLNAKNYKDALNNFNFAVSNGYKKIELLKNRANILNALGRYEQALEDCEEVLKTNIDDIDTLVLRASVYTNLNMFVEAEQDISKVLSLNPDNKGSLFLRIKIKFLQQKYDDVIKSSTQFLKGSYNFEILQLRAQAYEKLDSWQKACDDYTQIILNTKDNINFYIKRIAVYILMKDYQHALEDIDYVIINDEHNIIAFFYKGIICRDKGELTDALKNYDIALKLISENKIFDINLKALETDKYYYLKEQEKFKEKENLDNIKGKTKEDISIKKENIINNNNVDVKNKKAETKEEIKEIVIKESKKDFLNNIGVAILFFVSQVLIYFFCMERARDAEQEEISEHSSILDLFRVIKNNKQLLKQILLKI